MNNDRLQSSAGVFAHESTDHNSEQREALVLGNGPRLPPLQVSELSEDLLQIVTRMAQINSALASRERDTLTDLVSDGAPEATAAAVSNLSEIMRTMLRHPGLFVREIDIGIQLLTQGALSNRDRELAILRIGWLCQAPYEWGEHDQAIRTRCGCDYTMATWG
jgi:hypothetical protein